MSVLRTLGLFVVAWVGAGIVALGGYGFIATMQEDANFGRILAAYGGIFVAGSLAWGIVADGFKPDRYNLAGTSICFVGASCSPLGPPDDPRQLPDRGRTQTSDGVSGAQFVAASGNHGPPGPTGRAWRRSVGLGGQGRWGAEPSPTRPGSR